MFDKVPIDHAETGRDLSEEVFAPFRPLYTSVMRVQMLSISNVFSSSLTDVVTIYILTRPPIATYITIRIEKILSCAECRESREIVYVERVGAGVSDIEQKKKAYLLAVLSIIQAAFNRPQYPSQARSKVNITCREFLVLVFYQSAHSGYRISSSSHQHTRSCTTFIPLQE